MAPRRQQQQQGDANEPDAAEAQQELMAAGKQLIVLPVMWLSGKIDFSDPSNVQILRIVFCTMMKPAARVNGW